MILTFTMYLKIVFISQKNVRKISNKIIWFKQSLRDIILIFHDIAGLDMNLQEWKELCRTAWEND